MSRAWNWLRLWVLTVSVTGGLVIVQSLLSLQTNPHRYEWLFVALLTAIAGSFWLRLGTISVQVTISDTFFITTALLFGPAPATLAVALGTLISSWRRGHARGRVLFNTSACAIAIWAGSQAFFWMAGVPPLTQVQTSVVQLVMPLVVLTAVYFLANTSLIAIAVALEAGRPMLGVWREHFLWLTATYFAAASVSFCLVLVMYEAGLTATILVLLPEARRGWTWRTVVVGFAYATTTLLYVQANKHTTAASAIFLQSTSPLFILLLAPLLLGEHATRPKKKRMMYQELQDLPTKYNVIALSKMTKVRATQLMAIRKKFRSDIKIRIIKNKVAIRAFEKVKGVAGIESLSKQLEGQCALMFTNISPFKLNLIFAQNKVFLAAKGGDIATKEITVPAGNTGIAPGPVLSEFKVANVATKIDQGTIWVAKDTVVAKPGDVISVQLASLLSKLNVKPIEAGIAVNFAIAEGLIFKEQDLRINLAEYKDELVRSFQQALALATEVGYMTPETVKPLLSKAQQQARSLAAEAGYVTPETADFVLPRANAKAQAVAGEAKKKGYTAQ